MRKQITRCLVSYQKRHIISGYIEVGDIQFRDVSRASFAEGFHEVQVRITIFKMQSDSCEVQSVSKRMATQRDSGYPRKIQTVLHRHERTEIEPFIPNRTEESLPVRRFSDGAITTLHGNSEDKENIPIKKSNGRSSPEEMSEIPGCKKWTASEEDLSKWVSCRSFESLGSPPLQSSATDENCVPIHNSLVLSAHSHEKLIQIHCDGPLQVTSDFKGQTEPISRAPAANAFGMTEDELHFIQQELDHAHDSMSQSRYASYST